jgi:hypothetical protein
MCHESRNLALSGVPDPLKKTNHVFLELKPSIMLKQASLWLVLTLTIGVHFSQALWTCSKGSVNHDWVTFDDYADPSDLIFLKKVARRIQRKTIPLVSDKENHSKLNCAIHILLFNII